VCVRVCVFFLVKWIYIFKCSSSYVRKIILCKYPYKCTQCTHYISFKIFSTKHSTLLNWYVFIKTILCVHRKPKHQTGCARNHKIQNLNFVCLFVCFRTVLSHNMFENIVCVHRKPKHPGMYTQETQQPKIWVVIFCLFVIDLGPGTPHYNSSILADTLMESHLHHLYKAIEDCPAMQDAVVLINVWLQQRELCQVYSHWVSCAHFEHRNTIKCAFLKIDQHVCLCKDYSHWVSRAQFLHRNSITYASWKINQHMWRCFTDGICKRKFGM